MWRIIVFAIMMLPMAVAFPASAQEQVERPVDLAAMPVPPPGLPESGYQFARGGYLTPADVHYLIEQRYAPGDEAIESVVDAASWEQGYTSTYVLLSDRAIRTSDPLTSVTTTIHAFESSDGAMLVEALMTGSPPAGAEERDGTVENATTWRVVTSQDDTLVTVLRSDRFVIEVVTADRRLTPDGGDHTAVVGETLRRVQASAGPGLSQQMVLVEDDRLVPVAIATEAPLVHTWYRLLDDTVIPAAGELNAPETRDLPAGAEDIAIARQTAELSSQNWVTAGVVVATFDSSGAADAFAQDGVLRDPLDIFAASEDEGQVEPRHGSITMVTISGETRVGGRYSGYRVTVVDDATVAHLTIRAMGSALVSQEAVEEWAGLQRACMTDGACAPVPLTSFLSTPDPATPVEGAATAGEYASQVAPWSVTFDPSMWRVEDTFAQGGYDYLYLRSERMDATFETIVDHQGDPEQCVLNELDRLREDEDRAAITVGSDDEDQPPGGLTEGHGWVIYTVEPLEESRADEEYTIRIDCFTVVERSTSLVVQVRAPRDAWADVAPLGESLRSQIEIDGTPVSTMTDGVLVVTPTTRSDVMINRRPWVGIAA